MRIVVIENPILNSPFTEPSRHFRFDEDGITEDVADGRRISTYFVPVARPKKKGKQLQINTEWAEGRMQANKFINDVRVRLSMWRSAGYPGMGAGSFWRFGNLGIYEERSARVPGSDAAGGGGRSSVTV